MKPNIYSLEEHKIAPQHIDADAFYIIKKLKDNGYEAYLVGGSVRDLLLKVVPKDFDITTSARPEEVKALFRNCILIGRRFRLAHIRFGKKIIEVATFRSGDTESDDLIVHDNIWGSAEEDAKRRDFTINGLFYDVTNSTIIDYVGGVKDAGKRILKTIGEAEVRFRQDPVRMIRLLKFQARFGFEIDEETTKALHFCQEEILKSSQARLLEELFRMLQSAASFEFFQVMQKSGLLKLLLPKISNSLDHDDFSYKLLKEADIYIAKHGKTSLEKATLFALLIYPLVFEKLKAAKTRKIHLGVIFETSRELIWEIFTPFFILPRNIKAMIISIIINQFRFTPIDGPHSKIRLPNDPFFPMSLQFFHLRSLIDKTLLPEYARWYEFYTLNKKSFNPQKRYYRRRR